MVDQEMTMTAEQVAEMEALKNQELYGNNVKKIGECAVVTIEGETVSLKMPITYPQLVAAIIGKKYDTNQAEAVTANYLTALAGNVAEEKVAEYKSEYEAYQTWRNTAKTVAKEVIGVQA